MFSIWHQGKFAAFVVAFALTLSAPFITVAQGATNQDAIEIGFFGPLTGPFAGLGQEAKKGAELAIKLANAGGGINGRQLELVSYDDQGNRTQAVQIAHRLASNSKIVGIIDGSLSLTSIAAAQVINDAKIPMVVAYSNAVDVVKGNPYVFRWASVADVQGWIMAHRAVLDRGFKRFAILMQNGEYGQGIINGVEVGLKKLGGKVVYKKEFAPSEREFRSILTNIKNLNVDAVFVGGFGASLAAIAREGDEMKLFPKVQLYVSCDVSALDWYRGVGDKYGNGTIGTLEFVTPTDHAITKKFMADFYKAYGEKIIQHEAGLTYDATRLIADAIKRGGADREGIRRALAETKNFENLSGMKVSYTELREPMLPIAVAGWDSAKKEFTLKKYITDPALIDPRPWYKYY